MQNKYISFILYIILLLFLNISIVNAQKSYNGTNKNTQEEFELNESKNIMKNFSYECETKMMDYKMEYIYYIPIEYRSQEIYFENVTTVPTNFTGAFFIADETTDKIEFYIKNFYDRVIYQASGHYNIFEIPINKADIYTITFRNNLSKKKVIVTFTMNTGQNNFINSKDLSNTEKKLDNLESLIKKFNMEFKLNRDIHIRRYESKL